MSNWSSRNSPAVSGALTLVALAPGVLAAFMGVLIFGWNLYDPAQRRLLSTLQVWWFRIDLGLLCAPFILAVTVTVMRRRSGADWATSLRACATWTLISGLATLVLVGISGAGL